MPFVRIDALRGAVHDALVETIGIPDDDRFQVLVGHDGTHGTLRYGGYFGDGLAQYALSPEPVDEG
jgi:hypothetical protein